MELFQWLPYAAQTDRMLPIEFGSVWNKNSGGKRRRVAAF